MAAATGPAQERGLPVAPLLVAGVAVLGLVLLLVFRGQPTAATGQPPLTSLPPAGPPDLSQMTPREAFDRLYNRVMAAAEQADTGTVAQFSPMALQAYANLPEVDADARYHAAMLRLHTGDVAGAEALADSIQIAEPSHLFGFVLDGAIARFRRDQPVLRQIYQRFLAAYDEETRAGRPEYADHRQMLDGFLADARSGGN